MNMNIFMVFCLLWAGETAPAPFEMPLNSIRAYYGEKDDDANTIPIPYKYGAPPDYYPAIIPDYYDDNNTYPGMWMEVDRDCHSVNNCPGNPADPFVPLFPVDDYTPFPYSPVGGREWKCNIEADCFGQDRVPGDLSNDTQVLFLRFSNFTALNIGDLDVLPPLIKLRIEYSDLKTIQPRVFATQQTLQVLELVGNAITFLAQATFLELVDLTSLDLTSNKIVDIERTTFEGLDALTELRLASNSLTRLEDDTFREMPNLEKLILKYNNISTISRYAFRGLTKLNWIYLNYNSLREVPTLALRAPTSLSRVYLTGNTLRRILRKDFRGVEGLEELWLDDCEIVSIAKSAFQGSEIQVLVISENSLTSLPNLGRMSQLRRVVMDYNPWNCDCALVRTTKWLKRHNIEPESQEPTCATPEHLAGQQALELTNDDLCSSPFIPVYTRPMSPSTKTISVSRSMIKPKVTADPDSDDYDEIPEGGWSHVVYNPKELYTTVERIPDAPTPPLIHLTTHRSADDDYTTMESFQTPKQPLETNTKTRRHEAQTPSSAPSRAAPDLTPSGTWRKEISTNIVYVGSGDQHYGPSVRTTEKSVEMDLFTRVEKSTEESKGIKATKKATESNIANLYTTSADTTDGSNDIKPSRPKGNAYYAIAVIGALLLVIVVGAFVLRLSLSKISNEKLQKNADHGIELASANGSAAAIQENTRTVQNGNSSANEIAPEEETPPDNTVTEDGDT